MGQGPSLGSRGCPTVLRCSRAERTVTRRYRAAGHRAPARPVSLPCWNDTGPAGRRRTGRPMTDVPNSPLARAGTLGSQPPHPHSPAVNGPPGPGRAADTMSAAAALARPQPWCSATHSVTRASCTTSSAVVWSSHSSEARPTGRRWWVRNSVATASDRPDQGARPPRSPLAHLLRPRGIRRPTVVQVDRGRELMRRSGLGQVRSGRPPTTARPRRGSRRGSPTPPCRRCRRRGRPTG